MTRAILGLDVGGANLKAAHTGGEAVTTPFALWKQPDQLAAALADLVAGLPGFDALAVTMTGELCDCWETKREGVLAILDAVATVAAAKPVVAMSKSDCATCARAALAARKSRLT